MNATWLFSLFMLVSCFTAPAAESSQSGNLSGSAASPARDPFPPPKEGISIKVGAEGEPRLEALLNDFSRVTGQTLIMTRDVRTAVQACPTGLSRGVEVPAQEVYPFVEAVLAQNDFMLVPRSDREPRLLAVENLNSNRRNAIRSEAIFVPADQLAAWSRHPAILVTTVIDLAHTDVRTLANSMRAMFTDQSTQLMIPVGNSNSIMITATGSTVAHLTTMLKAVDDASAASVEAHHPPKPTTSEPPARDAPAKDAKGEKDAPAKDAKDPK
jgi:hypothetical protein